jgi:hypothetical protein
LWIAEWGSFGAVDEVDTRDAFAERELADRRLSATSSVADALDARAGRGLAEQAAAADGAVVIVVTGLADAVVVAVGIVSAIGVALAIKAALVGGHIAESCRTAIY